MRRFGLGNGQKKALRTTYRTFTADGILFSDVAGEHGVQLEDDADAFRQQLAGEELLRTIDHRGELLPWSRFYELAADDSKSDDLSLFLMPPEIPIAPRLRSHGSLTSLDFAIFVDGWFYKGDGRELTPVSVLGAIAYVPQGTAILSRSTFLLMEELRAFSFSEPRTITNNRYGWGKVRLAAIDAGARLDDFLQESIVLSPANLVLSLSSRSIANDEVVTLEPTFPGAPDNWLKTFDEFKSVRNHYAISTSEGVVHVELGSEVQDVLKVIKAMPGRRCAGEVAERFLANPYSVLGPDSAKAIDVENLDQKWREAGVLFSDFSVSSLMDDFGQCKKAVVTVTTYEDVDRASELKVELTNRNEVGNLVNSLRSHLSAGASTLRWKGCRLNLSEATHAELLKLETVLADLQSRITIRHADVTDLSRYSERISGIGLYIAPKAESIRKGEDRKPWLETIDGDERDSKICVVTVDDVEGNVHDVTIGAEEIEKLQQSLREGDGAASIQIPGTSAFVHVDAAKTIVERFAYRFAPQGGREVSPLSDDSNARKVLKQELLLRTNLDRYDYGEKRDAQIDDLIVTPVRLPRSLKAGVHLKEHQVSGVARMQALYAASPGLCRGVLLADEMGLGKSLQLLTLIASAIEEDPKCCPILLVAPVSLLENWISEAKRFFDESVFNLMALYGPTLAALRESKQQIDRELLEQGFTRFLKPDWLGDHKLVLTTYETLRDLEFSLAGVSWSMMICDEAQKIKNPTAMVTRAAKKQKSRFRVACTGTPVENSLQDLWCLFDFVQPGLLGGLSEFNRSYRRPIECETDEQRERVEGLRRLIDPQIIRRTKAHVAPELPPKTIDCYSRTLPISSLQRELYAIERQSMLQRSGSGAMVRRSMWQVLPRLRAICSNPSALDEKRPNARSWKRQKSDSPKLDWLISQLESIRNKGEKAIVFCEVRDMQRMLMIAIEQHLGVRPDIINGDTEVSLTSTTSRQRRLEAFQATNGFGVIILSPLTVGFGVNIQAANHVIHFVRLWNPAKEDQATDRAYRIGQQRPVTVYYPTIVANEFRTFDVKLDELLERKRALSEDMLNGGIDIDPIELAEAVEIAPDALDGSMTEDDLDGLSGRDFEKIVAALWRKRGYRTILTPASGDYGVDIVAFGNGRAELIQCKSTSSELPIGSEGIAEVVAAVPHYKLHYPGYEFTCLCVTNRRFAQVAQNLARINKVELFERHNLVELMKKHMLEVRDLALV